MNFFVVNCLIVSTLTLLVNSTSEESNSNSVETVDGETRDRRGVYSYHMPQNPYRVVPPLAAVAPLSIFAAKPTFVPVPAELVFHKTFTGQPFQFVPFNQFQSILTSNGYGFTPARQQAVHRPVILGDQHQSYISNIPNPTYNAPIDRCSATQFPCSAMVYCSPFYEEVVNNGLGCQVQQDAFGACCRYPNQGIASNDGYSSRNFRTFGPLRIKVEIPEISRYDLQNAEEIAFAALYNQDKFEIELQKNGITVVDPQRPEYGHLQFFRTSIDAMKIARGAMVHGFAGKAISNRYKLNPIQASFGLQSINTDNSRLKATCPPPPHCSRKEEFYRSSDGSCNNFINPTWGQARTRLERIVPPRYSDGISAPRRSVTGGPLPSPRLVSASNVPDIDRPSQEFTLSVMQWGQFLDHDLTQVPIFRFGNDSGIECCDRNGRLIEESLRHPECLPIEIPADDYFYSQFGRRCMNFVRSLPAPNENCTLGHRDQMNQVTHYLDASTVYGSSAQSQADLRAHTGGLLKEQRRTGLLPIDPFISAEDCFLAGTGLGCFQAGDTRVNEQPHLSIIHTIWFRQHNRIARELQRLNPHWDDETLFQETRRIVVAQIQHIVYNEWLPIILGTNIVEMSNLLPLRDGFSNSYNSFINAAIRNEFSSIAFRFGHTLVQGMIRLFDKNHQPRESINLHTEFNRPRIIYHRFDELVRGLFKTPIQSFDNFVVDDLTNRLFQTETMMFGMDLISLNTQRAREHAVGTYNDLREACGLPRARDFQDLRDFVRPESIAIFRQLYASVDDIDPFVAGISEVPVNDGLLGPLFSCIIRDQFTRLRFGDRFFYENGGMPTSFTEAQLHEIKKTSWASIICENSDQITKIQPLAFRLAGPNNEKIPCDSPSIPKLDLTPWISAPRGNSGFRS